MIRKLSVVLIGVLVSSAAWGFTLEVAESPSTSLSLTVSAIQSAQQSLFLNIYELSSSDVADALMARIRAGVHVEIIEEGQPVGGVSAASRGIQAQLAQAMRAHAACGDHFYEMTSHASGTTAHASKRRFHYDHAKYAVIDGKQLLIGSENYSPTGNPRSGTRNGNRGWEVLIHDPAITAEFAQIFHADSDTSFGDLLDLTTSDSMIGSPVGPLTAETSFEELFANALLPWATARFRRGRSRRFSKLRTSRASPLRTRACPGSWRSSIRLRSRSISSR